MIDYFKHIGKHIEWWQITFERVFQGHRGAPCESDIRIKTWKKGSKRHCCCSELLSVTKSCLTLRPHGLQHTRLLCLSSPWVCSNSSPLCQWWHATISSSVTPFSSYPQSFPESGFFPVSQLFTSGSQILELPLQHQSF